MYTLAISYTHVAFVIYDHKSFNRKNNNNENKKSKNVSNKGYALNKGSNESHALQANMTVQKTSRSSDAFTWQVPM